MSLLLTYFTAASDELAAATIDWPGGPEAGPTRRPFRRQQPGFPSVDGRGVDPVVILSLFEELLTGKSFDAQLADPHSRPLIVESASGEQLVIRIGDEFIGQLAAAEDQRLEELAVPWSQIEEFYGQASVPGLGHFLLLLKGLAKHTVDKGEHAYCWFSL